jgi:GNAT superfamily N-acetyltransferase
MSYIIQPSTPQEAELIDDLIVEFNSIQVPFTQKQTPILKNYVIKENDTVIAGINALIYHWGILYIDVLFVVEQYRGKQLGAKLLNRVEEEAIHLGANLCHLDTFDFQAKDFYIKQGYEVFGELTDCPPGHKRFYLKKDLYPLTKTSLKK